MHLVLIVIIALKHGTKGLTSYSSILIGIVVGYIAAAVMGMVLPNTAVSADGTEYVKAWVLNWDKVAAGRLVCSTKVNAGKTGF